MVTRLVRQHLHARGQGAQARLSPHEGPPRRRRAWKPEVLHSNGLVQCATSRRWRGTWLTSTCPAPRRLLKSAWASDGGSPACRRCRVPRPATSQRTTTSWRRTCCPGSRMTSTPGMRRNTCWPRRLAGDRPGRALHRSRKIAALLRLLRPRGSPSPGQSRPAGRARHSVELARAARIPQHEADHVSRGGSALSFRAAAARHLVHAALGEAMYKECTRCRSHPGCLRPSRMRSLLNAYSHIHGLSAAVALMLTPTPISYAFPGQC
jgi:hypothetical protein